MFDSERNRATSVGDCPRPDSAESETQRGIPEIKVHGGE